MMSALNAKALRARSATPDDEQDSFATRDTIFDQPSADPIEGREAASATSHHDPAGYDPAAQYEPAGRSDFLSQYNRPGSAFGQSIPTPPDPDEMPEPPTGPDIPEPPRRPDIPEPPDPFSPDPDPATPSEPGPGASTRSRLMAAFDALTGPMPSRTTFEDNTPSERPRPPEAAAEQPATDEPPGDKPTFSAHFESGSGLPSRKPLKSWAELESASTVDSPADNLFGTPAETPKTPFKSSLGAAFAAFELGEPTPGDAPEPPTPSNPPTAGGGSAEQSPLLPAASIEPPLTAGEHSVEPSPLAGHWTDTTGQPAPSSRHAAEPTESSSTLAARWADPVGPSAISGVSSAEPSPQAGWADAAGSSAGWGASDGRRDGSAGLSPGHGEGSAAAFGGRSAEGVAGGSAVHAEPSAGTGEGEGEGERLVGSAGPSDALDMWSAALPAGRRSAESGSGGPSAAEPSAAIGEPGPTAARVVPSGASVAAVGRGGNPDGTPSVTAPTYDEPFGPERRPEGLPRRGERSATTIASLLTEALAAYQSTAEDEDEPHRGPERYEFLGDPDTIAGRHRSTE